MSNEDFALAGSLLEAIVLVDLRLPLTRTAVEHAHTHASAACVDQLALRTSPLVQQSVCILVELLSSQRSH